MCCNRFECLVAIPLVLRPPLLVRSGLACAVTGGFPHSAALSEAGWPAGNITKKKKQQKKTNYVKTIGQQHTK
jgi:hypothetical protein